MKRCRILTILGLILFLSSIAVAGEWRAGVARVEITPTEPTWMAGFAARKHPAEGTLHPLWAKALVLDDGQGRRVAIVTADLIGTTRELGDAVAAKTGIPRERIVLNSSHTHCGPVIGGCAPVAYDLDAAQTEIVEKYRQTLIDKVAGVIQKASAALTPAELAYGEGKATFAINRRSVRSGQYVIAPNPEGPVDHVVPVLRVSDKQGRPLAVLFGYACHNTTLGGDHYQYNGDYAGFAQIAFEKSHPGTTALFMIGCGADSNPNPRGTVELAQQHGESLADAVAQALDGKLEPLEGPLSVHFERVDLPFVEPPTRHQLETARGQGNVYQQRLAAELLRRLEELGSLDRSYPCPIQVVRFGDDLAMVALSGETVVDYALRLRRELPDRRLWIAGYCNEVFAYVPSERVLAEGGYEGGGAMVYFGWHGSFQPGLEDRIIACVKKLLDK